MFLFVTLACAISVQAASILWYDSARCEGNWGQACYGITINDNYCCDATSYQIAPGHWSSHTSVKVATDKKDLVGVEDTVPRLWDADDGSPCAYEVEVAHEDGLILDAPNGHKEYCYYGVMNGLRQPVSGASVRWEPGNMINATLGERPRIVQNTNAIFMQHESNYYYILMKNDDKIHGWTQVVGDTDRMLDFMLENHDHLEVIEY